MALEKFHYEHGNKKISLPKFNQLPFGTMRKIRRESMEEQMFLMFELAADEKSLAVLDTMTMDEINDLVIAWQDDSGITQGES
ncbi:MAG: hypothetical protein DI609_05580 [Corynebacterium urealyticum]|uniref:Tail assembly chaperone n=1 Tax=Corynebacterium urealyticum TaxID=43771 RepID=A0A2W5B5Z6_9CORY|nr:MAG: hypothetical protein DI609_05580 [Corynebacterium urealyticum]